MNNLNITVLGFNRPLQSAGLVQSIYKYFKGRFDLKITIVTNTETPEWAIRNSFNTIQRDLPEVTFRQYPSAEIFQKKSLIDHHLVKDELNLVLPGNALFTREVDLDKVYYIDFNVETYDLFRGLNRAIKEDREYVNKLGKIKRRDVLFYEQDFVLLEKYNSLGKIFKHNGVPLESKINFFPAISNCFINTANFVEYVDEYEDKTETQNSLYTLGLRCLMGEYLDLDYYKDLCTNSLLYSTTIKTKIGELSRKINTLVDEVYYINLNRRHDRREYIDEHLLLNEIKAKRFEGIEPDEQYMKDYFELRKDLPEHDQNLAKARLGCTLSHLEIIKEAKEQNYDSVLILEDDCKFVKNPHIALDKAFNDLKHLPECGMLYLGSNNLGGITQLTPNIGKLNGSYTTHAYIVFKNMYDTILDFDFTTYKVIDEYYMNLCRDTRFNVYTVTPIAATQKVSYSDIEGKDVNYEDMIVNSYNNIKE